MFKGLITQEQNNTMQDLKQSCPAMTRSIIRHRKSQTEGSYVRQGSSATEMTGQRQSSTEYHW